MKTQRSHATVGLGRVAVLVLLAGVTLALAGQLGVGRELPRAVTAQTAPAAAPVAAGTDIFVTFDGIPGGSTEKDHMNWSDALSFSQGSTLPGVAGPASTTRAVMEDVVVTKLLDKASPKLAQFASQGTHLKNTKIHIARASSTGSKVFYTCELQDVLVTGYHVNASTGRAPVEELALNYRAITATYTEYDAAGTAKGSTTFTYRIQ